VALRTTRDVIQDFKSVIKPFAGVNMHKYRGAKNGSHKPRAEMAFLGKKQRAFSHQLTVCGALKVPAAGFKAKSQVQTHFWT